MEITLRGLSQRLWLIVLLPMLLIACCTGAFVAPAVPAVLGHLTLVLAGSQTTATITDIQPCGNGLTIAATAGNGFTYSSGGAGVNVSVSYSDSHGQTRQGQTTTCTLLPTGIGVGQPIAVDYRDEAPATILLTKDRGAYQGILTFAGIALAFIIGLLILIVRASRAKPQPTFAPAGDAAVALSANAPMPFLTETQSAIQRLATQAIGPANYPTRAIRLKEALMLLHLRRTTTDMSDDPFQAYHKLLRDHLVFAAMLMDLALQDRIQLRREGAVFPRWFITAKDGTPTGDPDTDNLLSVVQAAGKRLLLSSFYQRSSGNHLAGRLIDQLRQGGYVRLQEPVSGKFAQERGMPQNPLTRGIMNLLAPVGFNVGAVVATDDYRKALPWQFLYTTHTEAEESIVRHAQDAIAAHYVADDFTRALLLLVAAITVDFNVFPRRLRAAKSLYRLYPVEQRKAIAQELRALAKESPESLRAIYRIAKRADEQLEHPAD